MFPSRSIPSRAPDRGLLLRRHLFRGSALLGAIFLTGTLPLAATPTDPPAAAGVALRYTASVAGAPVGEATITVAVERNRYRVTGDARSNNWLRAFTDWRNVFEAAGRFDDAGRTPSRFAYLETDRDKRRHLVMADGVIRVTKNGKRRPERPAPPFLDVVSALFVQPRCAADQTVQTGRHVYRLSRLEHGPGLCRYVVLDDDDDSFEMTLTLGRRGGLIVPTRIVFHAWVSGRIELKEVKPGGSPRTSFDAGPAAVHEERESG